MPKFIREQGGYTHYMSKDILGRRLFLVYLSEKDREPCETIIMRCDGKMMNVTTQVNMETMQ